MCFHPFPSRDCRKPVVLNFWDLQESHGLAAAPAVAEGLLYHLTPYCREGDSLGWWEEGLGRHVKEMSEEDNQVGHHGRWARAFGLPL